MTPLEDFKKWARWGIPMLVVILGLAAWSLLVAIPSTFNDLANQVPGLRISSGLAVVPFFALFTASLLLMAILLFMGLKKAAELAGYLFIVFFILTLISIPIAFIGGPLLQNHYLPKMGYTECDKLRGGQSFFFNDWVKNPEWCVDQKDHAWVREQAAKRGGEKK